MNTSKVIKGVVGGGRYTVTAPIIKEDYGLCLLIEGLELPSTYQVDFSNDEHNGTSVTMIGNADGVLIPAQFIKSGKDVFAFLYHVGADFGRTVYKFRIPNKLRPDRTDEAPTPEEQSVIDQTISALNDAVESAQEAQEAIENMSVSAQTLAEGESATVTKTEQDGVVHLAFGIPTGATGAKGDKGDKGDTGEVTQAEFDELSGEVSDLKSGFRDLDGRVETLEEGGTGSRLTEEIKAALLQIAQKVAYIDAQGQDYYDDLYSALYPPKTLMRISAVYAQDDIVFTTDNLSMLKTDLTVYALYDDGSKDVVPNANYTLSGTLTEGTSTITVTYSGKTTTFNVIVTASAYTHYDYLATTSYTDSAYPFNLGILTDIAFSSDYTMHTKYLFTKQTGKMCVVMGVRNGAYGTKQFALYANYNPGKLGYWYGGSDTTNTHNILTNNTLYDIIVQPVGVSETYPTNATFNVNGTDYDLGVSVTGETWNPALAFFNYSVSASTFSVYENYDCGLQLGRTYIEDKNGNIIHDLRPATDGTYCGLHDVVTDKFYRDTDETFATYYNVGNWAA